MTDLSDGLDHTLERTLKIIDVMAESGGITIAPAAT